MSDLFSDSEPCPPRYQWLRRSAWVCALVTVMLIGLRLAWGHRARSLLEQEINRIIAEGEPLFPEHFNKGMRFTDERPTRRITQAFESLSLKQDQHRILRSVPRLQRINASIRKKIDELVRHSTRSRSVIRSLRGDGTLDIPLVIDDHDHPSRQDIERCLSRELSLVRLHCTAAVHHYLQKEDVEAVENLRDAFWLSRHIGQYPYLRSHLWSLYGFRWVVYHIEELSPDFFANHFDAEGNRSTRALIHDLLDNHPSQEQLIRGVQTERMSRMLFALGILEGNSFPIAYTGLGERRMNGNGLIERGLFEPIYRLDAARLLEHHSRVADAVGAQNWPAVNRLLPASPTEADPAEDRLIQPLTLRMTDYARHAQLHFRTVGLRRMGAVALAIRLFELDQGRWPEKLHDLVPEFLPQVPADPFDDGGPIRYARDMDPPILYSVALNGADEGGLLPPDPKQGSHWRRNDMPFYINGGRPW